MRTLQHIIDTRAIKKVLGALPDYWVIRELTERDYGIDLMVEIFNPSGLAKNDNSIFESTGAIFHIQVKGTSSELTPTEGGTVNFPMTKKALGYVESFSTPSLLFRVDVSAESGRMYFVWLQRYIKDVLDLEFSLWREAEQESFTIRIPVHNDVKERIEKIEKIASRPKFIEELVEFREVYGTLSNQLEAASGGQFQLAANSIEDMKRKARQLLRLQTLLKYNSCCVSRSCVEDLMRFLDHLLPSSPAQDLVSCPHAKNFSLLASSIEFVADAESFVAEHEGDTVY